MTESEFLSRDEIRELTARAHPRAQAAWLKAEGIPHQLRGRRLIVSRAHSRAWLEGQRTSAVSLQEPDLSCVQ